MAYAVLANYTDGTKRLFGPFASRRDAENFARSGSEKRDALGQPIRDEVYLLEEPAPDED